MLANIAAFLPDAKVSVDDCYSCYHNDQIDMEKKTIKTAILRINFSARSAHSDPEERE